MATNTVYVFSMKDGQRIPYISSKKLPLFRALDEAFVVQKQESKSPGVTKDKRIKYTNGILQKEMLPHVGVSETKKAYFLGFMVHRLLLASLGRRELDDRHHYGNKRLDLTGLLLAFLFRGLFKNLMKEV
uniref:DNA-directed RNA polymerase n=1 Tax=Glossina brevipalpis TaxID=37001 RepID=A0A1A9X296_9MUSC